MTSPPPDISIGLTGSIGSGKSFVTGILEELGHPVFDADLAVRGLTAKGAQGYLAVVEEFGDSILQDDDNLDRAALARVVFSNPESRQRLERLLHPLVREQELEFLQQHQGPGLPVLSIPLLFETGADNLVSHTVVVTIDEETRFARLSERDDKLTREQVSQRLAAQMPQEEKVRRADFIIDNSGDRESTRRQVIEILRRINS